MNATIKKASKTDLVRAIISTYKHDVISEGEYISKRRLWYILKPSFATAPLAGMIAKGKQVQAINNKDFNRIFNDMAKDGEIDDTYILDNSRIILVGSRLPHIILIAEKKTIEPTVLKLAEKLGVSAYIAGGFSSIYAAKKLLNQIRETSLEEITILMMSDYDKAGYEIQNTSARHFDTSEIYRVLLEQHQVPSHKLGEYFNIGEKKDGKLKGKKLYELDVLNIHELVEVFMKNIPTHISLDIRAHYKQGLEHYLMQYEVATAVDNHPDVIALEEQLELRKQELAEEYESGFITSDPITILPFTEQDIYNETVKYTVDKWMK